MSQLVQAFSSLGWMSRGACRQADPELFFPIAAVTGPAARQVEAAKAVCGRCVVRPNCLSYALEAMPEGIWGGTTVEERRAARGSSLRRARHAARQQVPSGRTALSTGRSSQARMMDVLLRTPAAVRA